MSWHRRHARSMRDSPGPSQTPPLPSSAIEYWHGELGASAASAIGQIQSLTLPGVNTPVVAADTGFFNERTVYQSATTGTRCWFANLGTIIASGTRPYTYSIARWRTVPSAATYVTAMGQATTAQRLAVNCDASNNRRASFGRTTFGLIHQNNGTVDTNVHRFEAWMDGTNRNFRVDGVNASTADADTIGLVNSVAIGSDGGGPGSAANGSVAFFLICSAVPSAGEISALNSWTQSYWAAP